MAQTLYSILMALMAAAVLLMTSGFLGAAIGATFYVLKKESNYRFLFRYAGGAVGVGALCFCLGFILYLMVMGLALT